MVTKEPRKLHKIVNTVSARKSHPGSCVFAVRSELVREPDVRAEASHPHRLHRTLRLSRRSEVLLPTPSGSLGCPHSHCPLPFLYGGER